MTIILGDTNFILTSLLSKQTLNLLTRPRKFIILKFHFGTVFTTIPVSLMRQQLAILHMLHLKETIYLTAESTQEMIKGHNCAPSTSLQYSDCLETRRHTVRCGVVKAVL